MSKTCPSCGYPEPDNQALYCNKCGYPFPQNQPAETRWQRHPPARPVQRAAKRPVHRKAGGGGFLSFGTLITENHLKLIYILGAVMIVLVSVMGIAGMFSKPVEKGAAKTNTSLINTKALAEYPAGSPLFWIGFLVIGSILWRMFCELFALLSRGQSDPPSRGAKTAYEEEPAEYAEEHIAAPGGAGSGQMVECPKCHKIVAVEDLRECEHCGVQGCSQLHPDDGPPEENDDVPGVLRGEMSTRSPDFNLPSFSGNCKAHRVVHVEER